MDRIYHGTTSNRVAVGKKQLGGVGKKWNTRSEQKWEAEANHIEPHPKEEDL